MQNIKFFLAFIFRTFSITKYHFMRKTYLIPTFILLTICYYSAPAQKTSLRQLVTISGYIEDSATGEKLPGATILLPDLKKGTTSNNYGYFTITLPAGSTRILLTHAGYNPTLVSMELLNNFSTTFKMQVNDVLQEVVVKSTKVPPLQMPVQMSKVTIPVALIKSMPRFLGETDVLKTLQLLPGVAQGTEGTSGVLVRGGSPDQNLILLDGTLVYNPSHLFGIFSSFNSDALKSVELYKGGFPARFDSRLSSVIDLVMKDGNMKEFHGEGSIGMLSSKLTLEGPVIKEKSSFLISGRRMYLDLLAKPIAMAASEGYIKGLGAYFYDANMKYHHILSNTDRLLFSFFSGHDFFKLATEEKDNGDIEKNKLRIGWGNTIGTCRWNHVFSKKLFANTLINFTQYRFVSTYNYYSKYNTTVEDFGAKYFSGIRDYGVRMDFDYRPLPEHTVKWGLSGTQHIFTPGAATMKLTGNTISNIDTSYNDYNQKSFESAFYFEDDWNLSTNLKINLGFHASTFKAHSKWYSSLQPRLGIRYLLPGDIALKASYTHMNQYVHLLTNNASSLPTDLWVPSTDKVKPMFSRQAAIGLARSILNNTIDVSIEGFYKTMDGIIEYKDGASYLNSSIAAWDSKVESGKGKAKGIELLIQKKSGRTNGWIGYTLSKSDRIFPEINFGKTFYYKYDRRHDFELVVTHKLSKRIEISGSWQFQTGSPYTLPVGQYEAANFNSTFSYSSYISSIDMYKGRNNFRLLNYHRLDLGITWSRKKKRYEKSWNVSLYNAYNRQNPFYYYIDRDYRTGKSSLKGITILPIFPSISYNFKF